MSKQILEEGWKTYVAACIPANATAGQLRACQYAFMGGASLMFRVLLQIGEPHVSDDEGTAIVELCRRELEEFADPGLKGNVES
jgi:hypothetical protein